MNEARYVGVERRIRERIQEGNTSGMIDKLERGVQEG